MFTQWPIAGLQTRAETIWLGVLLTASAGFVDAFGFLTLGGVYSANMSGNTVYVAIRASRHEWFGVWQHGWPLVAFLPGLIAGNLIVELSKRIGLRATLAPAMVLEALGLCAFILIGWHFLPPRQTIDAKSVMAFAILVGLLAFAMGLQNGALRCVGVLRDVHTYVTGTLLAAGHGFSQYILWLGRRLVHRRPLRWRRVTAYSKRQEALRSAVIALGLWTGYIVGGFFGAVLRLHFGILLMGIPIAVLIVVAIVDTARPLRRFADQTTS